MRIKRWILLTVVSLAVAGGGGFWGYKAYAVRQRETAVASGKDVKKADPVLALASVDIATVGPATLTQSFAVAGTVEIGRAHV